MELHSQVAVIIGSSRGLGREIAMTLAQQGVRTVLAARSAANLERVAEEVAAIGPKPLVVPTDATDPAAVEHLLQRTLDSHGGVDILVNCAGMALMKSFLQTPPDEWEAVHGANLHTMVLACRAFVPVMVSRKVGCVVNVTSKVGLGAPPGVAAYTVSKAAATTFSRVLAGELKETGVRVITMCPGPMDTPMRWEATPNWPREMVSDSRRVAALVVDLLRYPDLNISEPIVPTAPRA